MRPPVRFCTSSDGVRLAYAISGDGPPLVRAPHWFTHLEHDWSNPAMRPWVEDLSKRYSLLRFDQRGTGLSDREVPEVSFEAHGFDRNGRALLDAHSTDGCLPRKSVVERFPFFDLGQINAADLFLFCQPRFLQLPLHRNFQEVIDLLGKEETEGKGYANRHHRVDDAHAQFIQVIQERHLQAFFLLLVVAFVTHNFSII